MKIIKITSKEGVYSVTFKPNFFERLFGREECTKEYKKTGHAFAISGGNVYADRTGKELSPFSNIGEAIDNFNRAF